MLNLSAILEDSARRSPDKIAFIFGEKRLTYQQCNAMANQVANALTKIGVKKGDKVALTCPNLPQFPIIYHGILKTGAVVVPMSVLLKQEEVAYHLTDSDTKAYFCFEGTPELPMGKEGVWGFAKSPKCKNIIIITADPTAPSPFPKTKTFSEFIAGQSPIFQTVQTNEQDSAVIIYTSGTTGRPKGAELTHSNIFLNANLCRDLISMTPDDTQILALPLFHVFGQVVQMNAGIYMGLTSILIPRFDAKTVLTIMDKENVTIFAGVPTMYWALMNAEPSSDYDINKISKNLKTCASGGASLPLAVLEGFEKKFNAPIIEGYGMSEGSPVVTFNRKDCPRKPGSIGLPVWGVDVVIADENDQPVPTGERGQLLYRGHGVMKGYYKKKEATAETLKDGWLHSGDIAYQDQDGYFFIVDRTKDMIIRGGLNVYPREVEELMMKHEAVSLVAVIGVKNDQHGEEIKACVVLKPGATATEQELITWTKERIAAYKYPRHIRFYPALPMTASGKILKTELRKDE